MPSSRDALLDQTWPPPEAWIIVLLSVPGVLVVDAAWKQWARRRTEGQGVEREERS
jgi:hypothetical protein